MNDHYEIRTNFVIGESAEITSIITESTIQAMAEVTGDFNPVHIDEAFASNTRFKGRIAHGVLSAGLISAVLGMKLPGPGAISLSSSLKYLYPVRAGDRITAKVIVTQWLPDKRIIHLSTSCVNQDDKRVVEGEAVLMMEKMA